MDLIIKTTESGHNYPVYIVDADNKPIFVCEYVDGDLIFTYDSQDITHVAQQVVLLLLRSMSLSGSPYSLNNINQFRAELDKLANALEFSFRTSVTSADSPCEDE